MGHDGMMTTGLRTAGETAVAAAIWLAAPLLTAAAYMLLAVPMRSLLAWAGWTAPYWAALAVVLAAASAAVTAAGAWAAKHDCAGPDAEGTR